MRVFLGVYVLKGSSFLKIHYLCTDKRKRNTYMNNKSTCADARPLIMITNDDGVEAAGLRALADAVMPLGDVIIVAPLRPQSGQSSSLTINSPLRIRRHADYGEAQVYSVSGTPVDCVKLGLHAVMPRRPDFLFSGINHGSNSGNAVTYSGTMGAVIEGCTNGIVSTGFSLLHHSASADFSLSARQVADLAREIVTNGLPDFTSLNINIPAHIVPKGVRVCRAARGHWSEEFERFIDPMQNPFYWLTGRFVNEEPDATDTDEYWLSQGYTSIVPVIPDMTRMDMVAPLAARFDDK